MTGQSSICSTQARMPYSARANIQKLSATSAKDLELLKTLPETVERHPPRVRTYRSRWAWRLWPPVSSIALEGQRVYYQSIQTEY